MLKGAGRAWASAALFHLEDLDEMYSKSGVFPSHPCTIIDNLSHGGRRYAPSLGAMQESKFVQWVDEPLGSLLRDCESRVLTSWLDEIFGPRLLQLGRFPWGDADPIETSRITQRIRVAAHQSGGDASVVVADPAQLPFAGASVDLVILPHTLDLCHDPRRILREVDRVLVPSGRLITINFNPWSLWGLRHLGARLTRSSAPPWNAGFISYVKLSDWLSLLGLDIERTEVMMFGPPVAKPSLFFGGPTLERLGQQFWPVLAGVYMIQSIKRVRPLTPSSPYLQRVRQLGSGVLEPTARGT